MELICYFMFLSFFCSTLLAWDWRTVSIKDIQSEIITGRPCVNVIREFLNRIERYDHKLNSVVLVSPFALADAEDMDKKKKLTGNLVGPLHCVPLLLKDNIDLAGLPTAAGLKALNGSIPNVHADVVAALQAAGAVVIGKANMVPLGEQSTMMTKSEYGGLVHNPFSFSRTTFGSSGGNAAAIAAVFAMIGIGTDTFGGSIMLPSSACGIIGMRPGKHTISANGVVPVNGLLDTIGPMARWAGDLAVVMDVLEPPEAKNYSAVNHLDLDLREMNVAVVRDLAYNKFKGSATEGEMVLFEPSLDMREATTETINKLQTLGANVTSVGLNMQTLMIYLKDISDSVQELQACVPQWMGDYFGNRIRFPPSRPFHSFEMLLKSSELPSKFTEELIKASKMVKECKDAANNFIIVQKGFIQNIVNPLFQDNIDLLMFPAYDSLPPRLDLLKHQHFSGSIIAAFSGYAALTLPVDYTLPTLTEKQGLPIGMMFMGKSESMKPMIRFASAYQKTFGVVKLPLTVSGASSILTSTLILILLAFSLVFSADAVIKF